MRGNVPVLVTGSNSRHFRFLGGQAPITNILHRYFSDIGCPVDFAQGVLPRNYKLFQLADLICTLTLVKLKLETGEKLSESEHRFFGGARAFKHNELKLLNNKQLTKLLLILLQILAYSSCVSCNGI